jgi:hypothetical protein
MGTAPPEERRANARIFVFPSSFPPVRTVTIAR